MIRLVGILIGLGFTLVALISFGVGAYTAATEEVAPNPSYEFHLEAEAPAGGFSFDGPFGRWDIAQLQRGYQVYKEACAACHSLEYVAFRNLADLGYSDAQIKAEAETYTVPRYDEETAEVVREPGLPTDQFPPVPYAGLGNPPDLSLMTKARHDGTNYVYALLTGYEDMSTFEKDGVVLSEAYPDFEIGNGLYFNPYFYGLGIAMPAPLRDGQVTYADGTEATVDQMSQDIAAFLTWTAEPTMVQRKQTGWWVLAFTLFATILAWFAKKQIWADIKPKRKDD
ncbi:cytochrome c1 [Aurantiacibacter sediminis]|uniref:Cytochrome c1 n=1 Tax=Aurantiacibacter sediminis TaxID=2793064 RepID=A0ABS0N0N9_9SPHN|nr:cytochrome c1 [Aurantiacibacter sediminis]MBH5321498.1 cytochrome c1 [Aurantiacibacter sediminis]